MEFTRQDEVERKYQVDPSTIMPSLAEVAGVESVSQPVEHRLEALYFDTAGLGMIVDGSTWYLRSTSS